MFGEATSAFHRGHHITLLAEPLAHNGTQRNAWVCCVYTIGMTSLFSISSKLNILNNNEICMPCYPLPSPHCVYVCLRPHLWGAYLPSSLRRFLKYLLRVELVNDYLDKQDWKCSAPHTGVRCCRETSSSGLCSRVSVNECSPNLADPL